jgi:hypothetical protein
VSDPQDGSDSDESRPEQQRQSEFWRLMARYLPAIGLMPASALGGYLLGYGLDLLFSTTILRVVFMAVGIVSGIIQLLRILSRDR